MRKRVLLVVGVIILGIGFVGGYFFRKVESTLLRLGTPNIHADVSTEDLSRLGFPVPRPPDAKDAITAVVGNGAGDVVMYASFDLPESRIPTYLNTIREDLTFAETDKSPRLLYRESLPEDVRGQIWPEVPNSSAVIMENGHVWVGHFPGSKRLHFYTFPHPYVEYGNKNKLQNAP